MKLIMFGITDPTMTSEEVKQILADSFGDSIGNILEVPNEFFSNQSPTTVRQKKDSDFITACKGICKVCGDPVEEEGFRAEFWKAHLIDHAIEEPILEVLAKGPTSATDYRYLKKIGGSYIPKLATSALILK